MQVILLQRVAKLGQMGEDGGGARRERADGHRPRLHDLDQDISRLRANARRRTEGGQRRSGARQCGSRGFGERRQAAGRPRGKAGNNLN